MSKRVAIQMDPIASLNPHRDTSLLLGLEAQARGYELFYYTPETLSWQDGIITAQAQRIRLHNNPEHYYDLLDAPAPLDLATMDVVLLRQDPPFDMAYITTTYILEKLPPTTHVANNPTSVRNYAEKLLPMEFREFMPPTLVTTDVAAVEAFKTEHKDIVLKPLYGYGGRSVVRLNAGDDNVQAVMELYLANNKEPLMAQRFLPDVKTGDRRIILVDGKVAGIMGRIPAGNEIRANFRVGGSPIRAEITPRQREICAAIGPFLKEKGLILAGLDVIGDYLTEINLTSPTGLVQMNKLYGLNIEKMVWDAIEQHS